MDLKRNWDQADFHSGTDDTIGSVHVSSDNSFGPLGVQTTSYNLHLASCWKKQKRDSLFTMPWECNMSTPSDVSGKMMNFLQVKGNIPPFPVSSSRVERLQEVVLVEDALKKSKIPLIKASHDKLWEKQLSWDRKCACKKLLSIVTTELGAWEVVRQLASSGSLELRRGNLAESIYDSFANKATSTLHARAGPLLKFISYWHERNFKPFPVKESMVYEFIKAHPEAPPSAPRALLISLSFAYYVLGLEGGNVAEISGRVKGVADGHFCNRKKIIQKGPLRVEQVMALEDIVHDLDRSKYDRLAAGYFLF